jgi:hypothetical protein
MNITATAAEIIELYDQRWSIEVCIENAKQITGVGQARNRVQKAVERTVPFGLLCQSLTIAWYELHGQAEHDVKHRRRRSLWYHPQAISLLPRHALKLRRATIAAQYLPVNGPTPNPQEIPRPATALNTAVG